MTKEKADAAIKEGAWAFSIIIGLAVIPFTVFVVDQDVFALQPYKPLMASVAFIGLHTVVSSLPEVFDMAFSAMPDEKKRVLVFYQFVSCLFMTGVGMVAFAMFARIALGPEPLAKWAAVANVVFVMTCIGTMFYVRRTFRR